ncbi:MAG TPA: hypothetical protein VLA24_15465, partial [Pseudomonadales bacterium]|nr:hypothetical protein [Pseudomonadales bacterium]
AYLVSVISGVLMKAWGHVHHMEEIHKAGIFTGMVSFAAAAQPLVFSPKADVAQAPHLASLPQKT